MPGASGIETDLWTDTHAMEFDWNLGALADGLRCYRNEEFFVAHEHWEILWRKSHGPEKSFLQALIQLAGALHHLQRDNRQGATALLRAALRRLEPCGVHFEGVQVAPLREELRGWLQALEAGERPLRLPYPHILVDLSHGHSAPAGRSPKGAQGQ